jgi:hypothetical protein
MKEVKKRESKSGSPTPRTRLDPLWYHLVPSFPRQLGRRGRGLKGRYFAGAILLGRACVLDWTRSWNVVKRRLLPPVLMRVQAVSLRLALGVVLGLMLVVLLAA